MWEQDRGSGLNLLNGVAPRDEVLGWRPLFWMRVVRLVMAKMVYLLVLAGFIIGIAHLLPHLRPRRWVAAFLFVTLGFTLAQGALSGVVTALGLVPRGPFQDMLDRPRGYDGDRTVVLLVGSSFTQAGIDPDALAEILGTPGHPVTVLSLAVGGAPHLERLHYLKEYLTRAQPKPQVVLFEIAGGYDNGPLYQLHEMRFTDRMVAMMDGSSAWWAFRWLFGTDVISVTQRIILGGEIIAHLGLHVGHIGFLWNSTRAGQPSDYDPGPSPPKAHFSDDDVARTLDEAAQTRALRADWPQTVPTSWMAAFLDEEMSTLRRYGIDRFAFYSVPSMQGANVAYARRFCSAMTDFPCIVGEDPQLLAGLRQGTEWYDFDHLQGEGRALYTRWLGDQLAERGVLP